MDNLELTREHSKGGGVSWFNAVLSGHFSLALYVRLCLFSLSEMLESWK